MSHPRKPGIKDVAEAAGVSPTTVSHALNGKGRIAEDTRNRVLEVAEQLGYKPNASARRLVSGGGGLIALIFGSPIESSLDTIQQLPDIIYLTNIAVGASTRAAQLDLNLVLSLDPRRVGNAIDLGIDGALIVDPVRDEPSAAALREAGVPFVTLGRIPEADEAENPYWVDSDHRQTTKTVLDHLAESGAERIALVTGNSSASYESDSRETYEGWCAVRGIEKVVVQTVSEPIFEEADDQIRALLEGPGRPDAVLCLLHPLAHSIVRVAESLGLAIPGDLMLATISDDQWVNARKFGRQPDITGTELNPLGIAGRAVEMMSTILDGDEPDPPRVLMDATLVPRGSTAPSRT